MWKRVGTSLFKKPDEIGLDNYMVLAISFFIAVLGILGTLINIFLNLGLLTIISTILPIVIFATLYLYSRKTGKYILSKYVLIIVSLLLLNFQWFINFGSSGPILYLFVVVESFIIIFFVKTEKIIFTLAVFVNVSLLFLIEYRYPDVIGKYSNDSTRLLDLYSGMLIYLFISILLLNLALKFYINQQEKASLADKLKSAFLANMSHEIRTPMNGIMGFAQLLKEPNLTGDEQQDYISIIEKSGERMLNIINDIIDISKIESGLMKVDITESDINKQIEYVYTFFKNEAEVKGIKLSYKNSLPSSEAIIKTDPEKLYAILINLVKNAIKFTNKGSIDFGYNITSDKISDLLEFYVKDTGIGIPKDRQEAIFELFVQADIINTHAYQGAGLGLAISKAYVGMLSGRMYVESEPGNGTIFYFTIPYNPEKRGKRIEEDENKTEEITSVIKNRKILIAEDDKASEILISREVKKYCNEILVVNNGIDAVEVCRNNPDIDLILMDIKMPKMDGYEATAEIRKFNPSVVIIAQTAFALSGDKEKCLSAGCNDHISKPINNRVLMALIQEHLRN
jgi:signal transduction histidine kinase/ActR/RegA family two-component response regulator